MKQKINVLHELGNKIDLDLFYAVNIHSTITLQGSITSRAIRELQREFDIKFEYSQEEMWLTSKFEFNGQSFSIYLTSTF